MHFGPWRGAVLGVVATIILASAAIPEAVAQQRQTYARAARAAPVAPGPVAPTRTRFVIGLEHEIDFQVYSLTDPNRVYVELPEAKVQLPPNPEDKPVGLVKSFRGGLSAPGKQRVVIDVTGPVVVDKAEIETTADGQPRLVIDIVEVSAAVAAGINAQHARRLAMQQGASGLGAQDLQPPLPRPAISPQARAQHMYKPVIVIDPGHGGDDTGAQKHGIVEKDVVLAFSHKLREKLEASGRYKVLMTRSDDTFVELNARREFGEQNKAQLFVAVHADYANSNARGATIYSLRPEVAGMLQRSAKGDLNEVNVVDKALPKTAEADIGAVKEILADLYRREIDLNQARTSVFVKSVIGQMGASTSLKDNPDRQAAFVVLKSAKVPSILIELGYVTNAADAQLLGSEAWREKVSTSISKAIENYFQNRPAL
ncbi:MAG: N-acetylmuramoyl-L-alanine amidase [Hyphomicrobiaceae bacterium]|nr:N-acetylmuramoyl-L-alanine amidase [Hyphomicrobiaceae bacterium]